MIEESEDKLAVFEKRESSVDSLALECRRAK
jgi:hypothetical protein